MPVWCVCLARRVCACHPQGNARHCTLQRDTAPGATRSGVNALEAGYIGLAYTVRHRGAIRECPMAESDRTVNTVQSLGSALRFVVGEAYADRVAHQAGDIVNVEAFHDLGAVGLDGLDADAERAGDGLGGLPGGDQPQDLALA
jgi:hypothetical protein